MIKQKTIDNNIGKKYGRYTILSFSRLEKNHSGRQIYFYNCRCDCGTNKEVRIGSLQQGATISCGCYFKETNVLHLLGNTRARKSFGSGSFNRLFRNYESSAAKRGFSFELTKEQFKSLTSGKCFFCDGGPTSICKSKLGYGEYIYNGVDRLNNTKGYEINNCVTCCEKCNSIKNAITPDMVFKLYHALFKDEEML